MAAMGVELKIRGNAKKSPFRRIASKKDSDTVVPNASMENPLKDRLDVFLKHHFLMAMPGLKDPNFSQTVTCICEHSPMGAFGLIVNRIHSFVKLKAIRDELQLPCSREMESTPLYFGGPVHEGEIFILHGPPLRWEGSLPLSPTLSMSNTLDVLDAIVQGKGPGAFLIMLGCAGWGPGQLESEIKANSWLTGPVMERILFDMPVEKRWDEAIRMMGINPSLLADTAGHA